MGIFGFDKESAFPRSDVRHQSLVHHVFLKKLSITLIKLQSPTQGSRTFTDLTVWLVL